MTAPNLALSELCSRVSKLSAEELLGLSTEEQTAIQIALAEAAYDKLDAKCAADALFLGAELLEDRKPALERTGLTIHCTVSAVLFDATEACFNAAEPVTKQIIAISTAAPGWFGDECSL